jgi:virginiamycin B lyase
MLHKPPLIAAVLAAASLLVACGTSTGTLHKIQLHTPLQCPCPTIAPLATYTLPGEVPFSSNAYIGGIITGPDNNLWVAEFDADKIAKVTEDGTLTEYPVPTASAGPGIIEVGPDGALWFTEYNVNNIGRITTSGTVTEFPLPPASFPGAPGTDVVAAGPDNNLWFTHIGANVIGVMSTSGALITTYAIPTANSTPGFIIQGPDGAMWFNEETGSKIARITMSGVITEFPTPTPNCTPKNLVLGADGNMWFPERDCGNIARITPLGQITEYQVDIAPANVLLRRITSTPDGYLWFIQASNVFANPPPTPPYTQSVVVKMNTSGVGIDMWAFPNGLPQGLTVGPDGSPWFTDNANDSVVRL